MEEIDQQLIERYLANELSEKEKADFIRRRMEDAVFNQEVDDYETAKEALGLKRRDELRARIKGWDKEMVTGKPATQPSKKFNFLWLAIAVAVILAFLLWKFLFSPEPPGQPQYTNDQDTTGVHKNIQITDTLSSDEKGMKDYKTPDKNIDDKVKKPPAEDIKKGEQIFAENFAPYKDDALSPVSRGDNDLSPLDKFRKYYWEGNYPEALKAFSMLGQQYQGNDNLRFVYAIALAATNNTDVALLELKNIASHKKSIYLKEADWYMGLLYFKQGDLANARKYLQSSANAADGYNTDKAKMILEKLK